ncbi:PHP domain-containing protein [Candidatus Latescibacterota bacterium]
MPYVRTYSSEYSLFPRVVPAGWKGELVVTGDYPHTRPQEGAEYSYELRSAFYDASGSRLKEPVVGVVTPDADGRLVIPFAPDVVGEWQLTIDSEHVRSRNLPCKLGLFAQPRQWYAYRPCIGELHAHSTGSDGGQEPAYVPVRGRSFGMDFFALTDHRNFQAALEMKEKLGGALGRRMVLLAGEELHPEPEDVGGGDRPAVHNHTYHYVSIGQRCSVRDACLADPEAAAREIAGIADELRNRGVEEGLDVRGYAEGVWKLRQARELGGTTVLAHPYWGGWPMNLDRAAIEQSLRDREADAVEALSRADPSTFMDSRLIELAAEGITWPLVGVSDGHNWNASSPFSYCTFVMAESLSPDGVLEAVRAGRTVACCLGDSPRYLGPLALVEFAGFYMDCLLPLKRDRMALQAEMAFSYLRGGAFSEELTGQIDAELAALEQQLWAD